MKRSVYLFIFISIIYSTSVFAQIDSIPNSDFEIWQDFTDPSYSMPLGWYTADSVIAKFNQFSTVEKDTSAYTGNYCVRLTTKTISLPFIGNFDFPGLMSLGKINMYPFNIGNGIPDTLKPHHLRGYYKYAPQNNDSCLITAFLTRFIPYKGKYDSIGIASFKGGGTANNWTEFNAIFNYSISGETPDTINIVMLSSGDTTNVQVGSILWVDDISLEMSSGIAIDINPLLKTNIYPNPAKNYINLEFEEAVENAELIIYDINGAKVYNQSCCFGRKYIINTKSFRSGTYYFHLMLGNQRISSGSFIVMK